MSTAFVILFICAFRNLVNAQWNCSIGLDNDTCFRFLEQTLTWNEAHKVCSERGGQLPGTHHKVQVENIWHLAIWSSLCYLNGRLQWLGSIPYEERDWMIINQTLPRLASLSATERFCFALNGDIHPVSRLLPVLCVAARAEEPRGSQIRISSVRVETHGSDVDWGPIAVNRDGYVNVLGSRYRSFHLRCRAETDSGHQVPLSFKWLRNGAYMGIDSQNVSFASEEHLIPWIGFISCEASVPGVEPSVSGSGLHLSLWNTATLKMTAHCPSLCQWLDMVAAIEDLIRQLIASEFGSDKLNSTRLYIQEGPLLEPTGDLSAVVHLRNSEVDHFDFHLVRKVGSSTAWGSAMRPRSSEFRLTVTPISPCNLKAAEDDADVTWFGYLGQLVPSGNVIGGPVCVDGSGHVVTRSCGLPTAAEPEECAALKWRREEPSCLPDFQLMDGTCYRLIKAGPFTSAVQQCWSSWQLEHWNARSLMEWINRSVEYVSRSNWNSRFVWLPIKRPIPLTPLMWPVWNWTGKPQWMKQSSEFQIRNPSLDVSEVDKLISCVAYDLQEHKLVSRQCHESLTIVCSRPVLERPLSQIVRQRSNLVARYFCPDQWVTHWLVLDRSTCYRRFVSEEAVTWDQAADLCRQGGAQLATGPDQHVRIVLEQVHEYFSNQSVVDSWIGLRMQGDGNPAKFVWVNGTDNRVYNWQPYGEFGSGYGVSTGISRMWRTWPPQVKLWGFVCQKQVPNWSRDLNLQLKPSANGQYILSIDYLPQLDFRPELWTRPALPVRPDHAACYVASYFIVLRYPAVDTYSVQFRFSVPNSVKSGQLVCEIWFNQPPMRLKSNRLIHQSNGTLTYIIQMRPVGNAAIKLDDWANRFPTLRDLNFKPEDSWPHKDESERVFINYRVSVNTTQYEQLLSGASSCPGSKMNSQADPESAILMWIQSCTGNFDQFEFKVLSTVACQPETSCGLDWRKTAIGAASRPVQFCLTSRGDCLLRSCGGSYLTGAAWQPLPEECTECHASDEFAKELHQMDQDLDADKQFTEDEIDIFLLEIRDHFKTEPTGAQIQLVIPLLKKISNRFAFGSNEHLLVDEILNQIFRRDLLMRMRPNPPTVGDLVGLLTNRSADHHHLLESKFFAEISNFQPSGHFHSATVHLANATVTILRDSSEPSKSMVVVLPDEILPDDGVLYRRDPSDPKLLSQSSSFFRAGPLIHIEGPENNRSQSITFVQFHHRSVANYTCARWNPTLFNSGVWISNDCHYLGRQNNSEVCQCPPVGTFALFGHGVPPRSEPFDDSVAIYVAAAIFWVVALFIVLKFYLILPKEKSAQATSFEFCRIENRILLQLLIAWSLFLTFFIIEPLASGSAVACLLLTTFWQYFLFASMAWMFVLVIYHRRQLLGPLILNPTTFVIKISFFTWGLPSFVLVTIPIYKWDNSLRDRNASCWLDPHSDLWFTLVAITAISVTTMIVTLINCRLKKQLIGLTMTLQDSWTTLADVVVLTTAAILASMANSSVSSTALSATFCVSSSALALTLFFTYRRLLSKGLDAQPAADDLHQEDLWQGSGRSTDHLSD